MFGVGGVKARQAAPHIVLGESVRGGVPTGQEAAAERRVGDEADPEFGADLHHRFLALAGEQRPFVLHRGNGVYVMSGPQFVGGHIG
ncbi:hypothetical protein Airi02_040350 [Actinoallomurus iriomotensis]|uniref:Uncharacterized protein n=1 Tax=Actinoallomurus iriomotensis TaxID=478107 RepID=A0A9W6W1M6_9ACTN|nr:hypothetical protein Airi02_040350 [Actinoallomurus iriomotensis]